MSLRTLLVMGRFTSFAVLLQPIHKLVVHAHVVAQNSELRRFLGEGIFGICVHTYIRVGMGARCLRGWL